MPLKSTSATATEPRRLSLGHLPTPIEKLERLSRDVGRDLYIWRDDLSGFGESGNKVRKLEYILAEAVDRSATWIVTCGGPQSNHARATALLARRLGMGISIVVRQPPAPARGMGPPTGNVLLDRMLGAEIRPVSLETYRAAGSSYEPFLEEEAERVRGRGEVPYIVGEGGSSPLGCLGYRRGVGEMLATWTALGLDPGGPDALFFALGSGGTHAGLVLGYEANGLDTRRVHAVNVCNDRAYFEERVGRLIEETCVLYGLPYRASALHIHDGHVGAGYAQTSDDDLAFYCDVARREGVLLDPCYTGKAFRGMLREVERAPRDFGRSILFLHTGGVFANFAYAEQFGRVMGSV